MKLSEVMDMYDVLTSTRDILQSNIPPEEEDKIRDKVNTEMINTFRYMVVLRKEMYAWGVIGAR